MSSSAEISAPSTSADLRLRIPQLPTASSAASESQDGLDAPEHVSALDGDSKQTRTFGRTPDGTVFVVPTTHDMVSTLLDPRQPKNLSDCVVLLILALHILAAWCLPSSLKQPVFAVVFLFWRAAYNVGIGYLLTVQSNYRLLVTWAKKWKLFEDPATCGNPRPWLYRMVKSELEAKILADYDFEKAPIEYNTWLVFRRVVDLILMCDFVSYCLFAIVCAHRPDGEGLGTAFARWAGGIALFGFNLWVKLDAHRVVKDFAWYWGDFFFLVDQELTFDGVFELAPHPMYSIGYLGYYGISSMAASYYVLFISILAHAAQFAFLVFVEDPHMDKTYNALPPRTKLEVQEPEGEGSVPAPVHDLLGLKNFDPFRTTDYTLLLILGYFVAFTYATPSTPLWQALFVAQAVLSRVWFSVGLGVILTKQSNNKKFTRHFLKYGETAGEAWRQWKSMYHISLVLCHASFIAACWKMYTSYEDWSYGWVVVKYSIGLALVGLQMWTSMSIYDSLGEFGWFYGDFFFERTAKLTYTSIYRYLNNPERILGTAGLWGAALITWSRTIFALTVFSHLLAFAFISLVEKPHMQKIYGQKLRGADEAGVSKFIRRSLPPPVKELQKELQTTVDQVLGEASGKIDDFIVVARERLSKGSSKVVQDYSFLLKPANLALARLAPTINGYDRRQYSLAVEGTLVTEGFGKAPGKEGDQAFEVKAVYEYGAPIKVKWIAPANHGKKDWVGLYLLIDNKSKGTTLTPSQGRWIPTCPGAYDKDNDKGILVSDIPMPKSNPSDPDLVHGEMVFEGDRLWWSEKTFEFRYHHDGSHSVMAISEPFMVGITPFREDRDWELDVSNPSASAAYEAAVAARLLPVVRDCFDRDPDIAPTTADEPFGARVQREAKYALRVVYAIHQIFGVEFSPDVVSADGNVSRLAWRICNAKKVLAPFSMSPSKGPTTPTKDKFPVDAL